ncbi:MAG TPA: hypothetical protein VJB61_03015 [Actinomycetota bacterium]
MVALGALLVDQLSALGDAISGYAQQISEFLNRALGTELSGASRLRDNAGLEDLVAWH